MTTPTKERGKKARRDGGSLACRESGAVRLAKGPTFAYAMIKDAMHRGLDRPLHDALEIEMENFARVSLSNDAAIGIMSFLSKQEPEFTGE